MNVFLQEKERIESIKASCKYIMETAERGSITLATAECRGLLGYLDYLEKERVAVKRLT